MKNILLLITILAKLSLNGQVTSENISESDNNDSNSKLETQSSQFELVHASLMLFGDEILLDGNSEYEIVSLFLNVKKPYSIGVNCSNTENFNTNELGERTPMNEESKIDLSYLVQIPKDVDKEFVKLQIEKFEIDSVYYTEFLLINGDECIVKDINNTSISQLNSILYEATTGFKGQYYIIIKHFTFYRDNVLFEIPEIIGVVVREQ